MAQVRALYQQAVSFDLEYFVAPHLSYHPSLAMNLCISAVDAEAESPETWAEMLKDFT